MRTEIIPAILVKDFAEAKEKLELLVGFVKTVQIDVCDGQFVPNATWPYRKHDDSFERIVNEEEGLPGWQDLNFEIDLMANKPEMLIEEWVTAGASRIVIHVEAAGNVAAALAALSGRVETGLAIGITTPLSVIEPLKGMVRSIQCMGIHKVGFQGQSFDERVVGKVREVKAAYPDLTVSVDGGVSLETAPRLIEAGADRLVVGSAIWEAENFVDAIDSFKKLS